MIHDKGYKVFATLPLEAGDTVIGMATTHKDVRGSLCVITSKGRCFMVSTVGEILEISTDFTAPSPVFYMNKYESVRIRVEEREC